MKTYEIKEAVRCEHRIGQEAVAVSFDAGTVTPKDANEERVLRRLTALGLAEESAPKKRASKPSEEKS